MPHSCAPDTWGDADLGASPHRTELTPESPLWVGAWWVGFLGAGAAALLIAIPILGYPRQLPGGCTPPPCVRPCSAPLAVWDTGGHRGGGGEHLFFPSCLWWCHWRCPLVTVVRPHALCPLDVPSWEGLASC